MKKIILFALIREHSMTEKGERYGKQRLNNDRFHY
jgi:hypothetical protein